MNSKTIKEIKRLIKEEMPVILSEQQNLAQHTKLATEMKTIVEQISQKMLENHQYKTLVDKITQDVKDRMDSLDKYIKETNEARAAKLEETLKKMMENQVASK